MSIKGKTAVVTGSTSGIGLGIAQILAKRGANIILNGFGDPETIEQERLAIEMHGVQASYDGADMTDPAQIARMIEHAHKTFGSVDIVINNAGIQHVAAIEDFPLEKWDAIIAVNMSSAFHVSKAAIPIMKASGWGRIINLVSVHGLVASPFKSAYVTAKHGVIGMTKTIALEVARNNITCNAICPGYVYTPLVENQITDTAVVRGITEEDVVNDVLLAAQATKKFTTIEQIGETAAFLCSPAADNITGTSIAMDGGWTAA